MTPATPLWEFVNVSKAYPGVLANDKVNIRLMSGSIHGLLGENGCGKSTFLKILAGLTQPDAGEITRRTGLVTGYLPQDMEGAAEATVMDTIRDGAAHAMQLLYEYETLAADSSRQSELEQQIAAADAWNIDTRIKTAMTHLNAPEPERLMGTLSGGEKLHQRCMRSCLWTSRSGCRNLLRE